MKMKRVFKAILWIIVGICIFGIIGVGFENMSAQPINELATTAALTPAEKTASQTPIAALTTVVPALAKPTVSPARMATQAIVSPASTDTIVNKSIHSACGCADYGKFYSRPTSCLCDEGTPSEVKGTGPWTWTCDGEGEGSYSVWCAAEIIYEEDEGI